MAFDAVGTGEVFLLGRILFASILSYLAIGNLLDLDESIGYAASKGVPTAWLSVPLGSVMLLLGAVSILIGAFPLFGAVAIVGFLATITPMMHDFWNAEGMDRQNEQIHFLKNAGLAGTALLFGALAGISWPYAVNTGTVI